MPPPRPGAPAAPRPGQQAQFGRPAAGGPPTAAQWGAPGGFAGVPAKRPGLATAVGILEIIGGGLGLLIGLFALLGAAFLGAVSSSTGDSTVKAAGGLVTVILLVVGIVVLILGAVGLVMGIMVLKGKNWARMGTIVVAGLSILSNVVQIIFLQSYGGVLSIGLAVFYIIAMLNKDVVAWFNSQSAPRAPSPYPVRR